MDVLRRSFDQPDEHLDLGGAIEELISIGGLTVSRSTMPVEWSWHDHLQPLVGGDRCQAHHVGIVVSGRFSISLADGTRVDYGPSDLYDIPPGHEERTVGDQSCVLIEWSGMRRWFAGAAPNRVLASLLFTDLVDSTTTASRLGDAAWHDLLTLHYQQTEEEIERFGGRRVATTGDGVLATFDGATAAVRCAVAVRDAARRQDLSLRLGVHIGEVELADTDVRGLTVHEAARVMAQAGPEEILVTDTIRLLCKSSGFKFEDGGEHDLKGVPDRWHLYRVIA